MAGNAESVTHVRDSVRSLITMTGSRKDGGIYMGEGKRGEAWESLWQSQ